MSTRPLVECSGFGRVRRSFLYAFRGVGFLLRTQTNARIHLVATVVVIGAGFSFEIRPSEWLAVVVAIGLVWTAEGLNTAIEALVDLVSQELHPMAGRAKDVAAGAVLIAALAATVIGVLVFGPRLLALVDQSLYTKASATESAISLPRRVRTVRLSRSSKNPSS